MNRWRALPGVLTALCSLVAVCLLAGCRDARAPWPQPPAGALVLELLCEPRPLSLLEPWTVHLDLYRRADLEVEFAPQVPTEDFLSEVSKAPEVPFGGGFWQRTTVVLRPIRGPGELELPGFTARAQDGSIAASTPAKTLTVVSTLADAGPEIEAPSAPLQAPLRLGWWLLGAVVLVGLLAGLCWLWPARRAATQPMAVALPCHVKAQRAFLRLRSLPRTTPAEIGFYYVELSQVLRVYLEERFGLRAPERTTEEFLRDLEGGDQLAREHRAELQQFLGCCDLVKFAAQVPSEAEQANVLAIAESFVEATRPDRERAPGAGGGA